jgi:hypothetical protein
VAVMQVSFLTTALSVIASHPRRARDSVVCSLVSQIARVTTGRPIEVSPHATRR